MDEASHYDDDVEHVIKFYGISDFRYHNFGAAASRLADLTAADSVISNHIEYEDQDHKTILPKSNMTMLSSMFKTLYSEN